MLEMLKYTLIFALAVVLVSCSEDDRNAELLKSQNLQNLDGAGQFQHEIETSNGISVKAKGNVNGIQGEYFLLGEDGKQIRVTYTADATGFHPQIN
ncbi:pupal cuticle protein Edg-78E [Drosophila miranda]|uniref:Pupal cuticle protein Edg-78E n=2 Tax=pseudoobscura subgroup TaxID=32358 RepID=A0A6I8USA0_DROPS|nr:pupal cuticle protein Edg-78E [Drosophila pseudoobscura]XP_017150487.1 pupal cuticle protein Edg-78E [Drosophila miranda]